jgi:hypothetical protein
MTATFEPGHTLKRPENPDPAAVVVALEKLARKAGGVLTPDGVLRAASSPRSPLHGYFTWADNEAARAWRLHQARNLIASVRVQMVGPVEPQEPVRAWVSVSTDAGRGYRALESALADPLAREDLLTSALRELERVRRQYAQLEELSSVWAALDQAAAR